MDYKVVVTRDAEEDLERFIKYLIFEKKSLIGNGQSLMFRYYSAAPFLLSGKVCYIIR